MNNESTILYLDGNQLTFGQIKQVFFDGITVDLTPDSWIRAEASRKMVEDSIDKGKLFMVSIQG
ncbi:hypothetical protein [Tepidibacillus marianensis]|uniref:hypothetical protein n=1 Tax=Tepidibacillus marianensis TaxID=3131995 RepID=UPI0030D1FD84